MVLQDYRLINRLPDPISGEIRVKSVKKSAKSVKKSAIGPKKSALMINGPIRRNFIGHPPIRD